MTVKHSVTVYSTLKKEPVCRRCGETPCTCRSNHSETLSSQPLRIRLDRKGRKGKSVTLIEGVPANSPQTQELCRTLKNRLGAGGTVREGGIEIQGDQRGKIVQLLAEMNYKTKLVGG
ncbi:MAG TPA: translation initiation factor [bacterium]|nr:translation initiation factor [bacterium]HPN33747.1 translation initiation factor [bacterium]